MKFLLDTNICIHFLRGRFNLSEKFISEGIEQFAISEITLAELVFGAENSSNPSVNLQIVEDFSSQLTILPIFDAIHLYGKEKARVRKSGEMISDFDLLIGCSAIENELILVTENISEFKRIQGIELESWIVR